MLRRLLEPKVTALIGVVNHRFGPSGHQRHIQRQNHQISRHVHSKRPAHHFAAVHVCDHRQIQETRLGRYVGHVGHPQLVDIRGHKLAFDQIRCWPLTLVSGRGDQVAAPAADTADVSPPHNGCNAFAAGNNALIDQLRADARHAVSGVTLEVSRFNLRRQRDIGGSTFAWHTTCQS